MMHSCLYLNFYPPCTHTRPFTLTHTTLGMEKELVGKDVSRLGWQKLWPIMAGHRPLTGNEGHNRLDNHHHPGSVGHDLAGVQASRNRVIKFMGG